MIIMHVIQGYEPTYEMLGSKLTYLVKVPRWSVPYF
jgi:hypothetical protein